ncbi:MAG: asparagine synthase (glutamine-hydrolyzing) [Bacteroidota bacterium]
MCGIAGWIGKVSFDKVVVSDKMKKAMYHRGPDLQIDMHWDNVTFIHNRLKIIDLSELGNQPMSNEDGTVWIVFNGEIYNHHDLRTELEAKGHIFRSKSDTEVIIHLYEEMGADFVNRLRGMFAICIYDKNKNKCVIARDRFGIKPLFYYQKENSFLAFASELNTIKQISDIDLSVDMQSIYDFTALFYIPAPATFYKHIHAVMPGEVIEIANNGSVLTINKNRYYRHLPKPNNSFSDSEVIEEVKQLIERGVSRQLEADVPLGSLLSGGIDSSLVSYFAQKNMSAKLNTYNVKFQEAEYDESWAAIEVAEQIHSNHSTLQMAEQSGNWEHVIALLRHAGQPFADTSIFAVQGVSALMKQYVTVAMSGDGGDEAFGGYTIYNEIEQINSFNSIPKILTWPLVNAVHAVNSITGKFARPSRILKTFYNKDVVAVTENMYRWMKHEEHDKLWKSNSSYLPVRRYFESDYEQLKAQNLKGLELLSALCTLSNTNLVLPNDFLFKVDTASMHESIEIRVPMLDEDLFERGMHLPHRLKTHNKELKYILRGVAKQVLPEKVANKPKWGFGIPVDTWVNKDFKSKVYEYINNDNNPLKDILDPIVYKKWIDCFCNDKPHTDVSREGLYQRMTMLLALSLHLEK